MSITWTEELSVGVDIIDNQHKELINQINALLAACKDLRGAESTGEMLNFLSDYVISHFKTEERFMEFYRYPDRDAHKAQHEQFTRDFLNFRQKFISEGASLNTTIQINHLVVDWLIKHIFNTDRQLGAFLRERMQVNEE